MKNSNIIILQEKCNLAPYHLILRFRLLMIKKLLSKLCHSQTSSKCTDNTHSVSVMEVFIL